MKAVIYYFTGTGNSLHVARGLSSLMADSSIIPISGNIEPNPSAPVIGIVLPVYLWGIPKAVAQFLERVKGDVGGKYFFAVATYKSQTGDALGQMRRKMMKCGMKLTAGFYVPMPGNNIIMYDIEPSHIRDSKLSACDKKLTEIVRAVEGRQETLPSAPLAERVFLTGWLHSVLTGMFEKGDKNFWIEQTCNGCGTCARVCPVGNIEMADGQPVWQHRCEQCLACIHACPAQTIQYGKTTCGRQRYIHPQIDITDLFRRE